jgi:hypothetical protein
MKAIYPEGQQGGGSPIKYILRLWYSVKYLEEKNIGFTLLEHVSYLWHS